MKTKLLKKSYLFILAMLVLCVFVPASKVSASNVKNTGFYLATNTDNKSFGPYFKKAKFSNKSITSSGVFYYYKNKAAMKKGKSSVLKAKKRTFILSNKTKFYISKGGKNVKTSRSAAFKKIKKMDYLWDVIISVKKGKVVSITLRDSGI